MWDALLSNVIYLFYSIGNKCKEKNTFGYAQIFIKIYPFLVHGRFNLALTHLST